MTTIYSSMRHSTQTRSDQVSPGDLWRGEREINSTQPRSSKLSQPHHVLVSTRTQHKTQICQWQEYIILFIVG